MHHRIDLPRNLQNVPLMKIGLTGYSRVGKDIIANRLVEKHGFTRVAIGDYIKAQ